MATSSRSSSCSAVCTCAATCSTTPSSTAHGSKRNSTGASSASALLYEPPVLQLVYAVAPAHTGRAIAGEMARAVIKLAFSRHGFHEVRASTDEPNRASVRVLERLGMKLIATEPGDRWTNCTSSCVLRLAKLSKLIPKGTWVGVRGPTRSRAMGDSVKPGRRERRGSSATSVGLSSQASERHLR